jgi:hypothetical protein
MNITTPRNPSSDYVTQYSSGTRFADSLLAGIKRLDRHLAVMGWTRM